MSDISELIAACRARLAAVTDHPASDPLFDYAVWAVETMPRLLDALEAAQRPPLGYMVARVVDGDGPSLRPGLYGSVATAIESVGRSDLPAGVRYVVAELREVQP